MQQDTRLPKKKTRKVNLTSSKQSFAKDCIFVCAKKDRKMQITEVAWVQRVSEEKQLGVEGGLYVLLQSRPIFSQKVRFRKVVSRRSNAIRVSIKF